LIQNSIIRLIKLFPDTGIEQSEIDQFNREVKNEIEHIRDFIIAHYHVTQRADTAYWNECREMDVPETLAHKLRLFKTGGKIFRDNNELFSEPSWVAVLVGQGIEPDGYHPFVENMSDKELNEFMARVRSSISKLVSQQPTHHDFVRQYCQLPAT
jgi:tryptophan halogenase